MSIRKASESRNLIFEQAVKAIDMGHTGLLENLVKSTPELVAQRHDTPDEGYFKHPYLLWFVADNPIRNEKLADNIMDITRLLTTAVKSQSASTAQEQLDYTLGLVATGRIPKESGKQIEMIDLLIDEGAKPGGGIGALAHGNPEAAEHLIKRGGKLTLPAAIGLERMDDIDVLLQNAGPKEQLVGLTIAAFYGKSKMVSLLLSKGCIPNGYPENGEGFHAHATPLHQAVFSGSLETVKLLVDAGADLNAIDRIYSGTPMGWAEHMKDSTPDAGAKARFATIAKYFRRLNPT